MGAKVAVNYRSDKAAAEETAAALPGGTAHKADVGDPAQVEAMVKAIGRVDILVNNAGAVRDKLLIQMAPADWEELIRTDLMSAFATTRAAIMSGMMRGSMGPDRQHLVDRRDHRQCGSVELRGGESRPHRVHQIGGARVRFAQHHMQCRGTGVRADGADVGIAD